MKVRYILKILGQETASNKKKAKSEVCIQSLQEVFPKVYSDWISLNTQRKEIAQKGNNLNL